MNLKDLIATVMSNHEHLTGSEWMILNTLYSGKKNFGEIVDETGYSKTVVSTAIRKLENKSNIKKGKKEADKRIKIYKITEKGKKAHDKVKEDIIKDLSDDLTEIKKKLNKMTEK
ncbi:MAG: Transcriptional regulator, MarR family [Candidatus Methanohalarchaeum thermophilum]|uniref:Transcriptional regulator, MarR family n=1 Tax=Methanohalarchaeum thermophilum TaxID=1903181 RepID=A0A1Q6DT76_METT1|nr:MAG: Transcriptional regulator, MarR family [Candidatus Methanohalarchaeum thermophilum]